MDVSHWIVFFKNQKGVWDVLSYQDVVDFVKENLEKEKDPQKVSELLVQHAFNKGSTDNITALIVTLKPF